MWPMGHVAVAYLLLAGLTRLRGTERPSGDTVLLVVVASLLPDLIDKPLAWYLGVLPSGRSLMHSLVILVPLCIVIGLAARSYGKPMWGVAVAIGLISHALLDALPALWREGESATFLVYPLIPDEGYGEAGPPGVVALLLDSATDPYFLLEFPLLAIAFVAWYHHGMPGSRTLGSVRREDS